MAIALYFNPPAGMTSEQYEGILRDLEAAGQGSPDGRTYHACFGEPGQLQVFDVWDSMEQFERFGETLMPLIEKHGLGGTEPMIAEVRNVITG